MNEDKKELEKAVQQLKLGAGLREFITGREQIAAEIWKDLCMLDEKLTSRMFPGIREHGWAVLGPQHFNLTDWFTHNTDRAGKWMSFAKIIVPDDARLAIFGFRAEKVYAVSIEPKDYPLPVIALNNVAKATFIDPIILDQRTPMTVYVFPEGYGVGYLEIVGIIVGDSKTLSRIGCTEANQRKCPYHLPDAYCVLNEQYSPEPPICGGTEPCLLKEDRNVVPFVIRPRKEVDHAK